MPLISDEERQSDREKSAITNTAEEPSIVKLFTALPGGIEAQERRGQRELVQSSQLPAQINSPRIPDQHSGITTATELYEKLGVKVVGPSKGDNLFLDVVLPDGWRLESTDHDMWNRLVDSRGRERASIFYKAAFYDRKAHLDLTSRYSCANYEPTDAQGNLVGYNSGKDTHYGTYVKDGGKRLQLIAVREKENSYEQGIEHRELAKLWLDENHPDWENCFAYWD